ncbi:MAG: hypothetical protein U0936_27125 [Planctomycetaceae bacterium]
MQRIAALCNFRRLLVEPTDPGRQTDDKTLLEAPQRLQNSLHGPYGLRPSSVDVIDDNVQWTYNLTVGPGGSPGRLASFTVLNDSPASDRCRQALVSTNGFGGQAAAL